MSASVDYYTYLASREWALKKEAIRERSRGICERCHQAKHEQTHHLTYERLGNERLEDLLGLCKGCHEYLSAKSANDPVQQAERLKEPPDQELIEYFRSKAATVGLHKESLDHFNEIIQHAIALANPATQTQLALIKFAVNQRFHKTFRGSNV